MEARVPSDPTDVPAHLFRHPPADMSPDDFEDWIGELLDSVSADLEHVRTTVHDKVVGTDGTFDLDATVRFRWAGMDFLVVVEAKRHAHPIKRELVQILHSKVRSTGAHKGVLFSTAPLQRGALEFAKVHGIALVHVTEGRFTFETRARDPIPPPSREDAKTRFGLPVFAGHAYGVGDSPASTSVTLVSSEHPDYIRREILGLPDEADVS